MAAAFLMGSLVGLTLGILGGGGSTLAVPLLAYGLGFEPRRAIATSLVVVALAALAGAARHWRQGTIDAGAGLTFGLLGSLASAAGAQAARFLDPHVQMTMFALTLLGAAGMMFRKPALRDSPAGLNGTDTWRVVLAAVGTGLLTGLVGVGGGFLIVPALVFAAGLPIHRAMGTSLLVIVFNALGGVASYASYETLLTGPLWAPFAVGAVVSAIAGAAVSRRIEESKLRSVFAVGLILLGLFTIAKESFLG